MRTLLAFVLAMLANLPAFADGTPSFKIYEIEGYKINAPENVPLDECSEPLDSVPTCIYTPEIIGPDQCRTFHFVQDPRNVKKAVPLYFWIDSYNIAHVGTTSDIPDECRQ